MKKIIDKIITGFFVFSIGVLWYCSTKYHVKPNQYNIIVYDQLGKEFSMDDIRTNFKTKQVAKSYLKEYQRTFPYYDFSIEELLPEFKRRRIFSISN